MALGHSDGVQGSLFEEPGQETPVVLSYGLAVDSTSILLRWLHEPESRDFPLEALTVLTSMTGDEFQETGDHVTRHILPLLRQFRIRFVQVARAGPLEEDGITVLDDSREPTTGHLAGAYKLSTELLRAGTVPQVAASQRRCTAKAKGFPLDSWVD